MSEFDPENPVGVYAGMTPAQFDQGFQEWQQEQEARVRHRRSVSQLDDYLKCGESYRLARIAKAPQRPAAWLTQGVAFHEAIENWETGLRTHSIGEAQEWYDAKWDQHLAEQLESEPDISRWLVGGRKNPQNDIDDRYALGRAQVAGYIEYALAMKDEWRLLDLGDDNLGVELPFDIIVNGVRIVGFIDQVIEWRTGAVTVRDLKTGTQKPKTPRQLGVYKVALEKEYGITVNFGDFFMCKDNAPTALLPLDRYTPERVGRWFKNVDDSIEDGRFTPNPGDHCRICSVQDFCDLLGGSSDLFPAEIVRKAEAA